MIPENRQKPVAHDQTASLFWARIMMQFGGDCKAQNLTKYEKRSICRHDTWQTLGDKFSTLLYHGAFN